MQQEKTFENKVLQGITLKNLLWVAGIMGMLFLSGVGYVSTIKKDIQSIANDVTEMKTEKKGESKFNDLQYKILEQKVDQLGLSLKQLEEKYNLILENKINR